MRTDRKEDVGIQRDSTASITLYASPTKSRNSFELFSFPNIPEKKYHGRKTSTATVDSSIQIFILVTSPYILAQTKLKIIFLAAAYRNEITVRHYQVLRRYPVNVFHIDIIAFMRLTEAPVWDLLHNLIKRCARGNGLPIIQMYEKLMAEHLKIQYSIDRSEEHTSELQSR